MVLREVDVSALALERLHSLIGPERSERFDETAAAAARRARRPDGAERELDRDRRRRRRAAADVARVRRGVPG